MSFVTRVIVMSVLLISSATASEWVVRDDESRLGFVGTQAGREFEGAFERFNAIIHFDPDNLEQAGVDVTVDIASFHWMNEDRHALAMSAEWFAFASHPEAHFTATEFIHVGDAAYQASGTLEIKGITRDFALPFDLVINGDVAQMTSTMSLMRRDFSVGLGEVDDWFGNEVLLQITLTADRQAH